MGRQTIKASEVIDIVLKHACVQGISEQACVNAEIGFEDYTECLDELKEYFNKVG